MKNLLKKLSLFALTIAGLAAPVQAGWCGSRGCDRYYRPYHSTFSRYYWYRPYWYGVGPIGLYW